VASRDILQEYKEVLSRKKFNLPVPILEKWMKVLDKALTIVPVHKKIKLSRDKKDEKFLECAVSSQADFFITGDRDFESAQKLEHVKIISVSIFKKLFLT
jgi:uncharacterized protein